MEVDIKIKYQVNQLAQSTIYKQKEVIIMSSSIEVGLVVATMNRVNGAGVRHLYFNATDKEIKYLTFVYMPYNQVGDQVQCTISKKSEVSCKITGPIKSYVYDIVTWEALWYNPTATSVKLVRIYVEYMDGTDEIIDGADIVDTDDKQSVYHEKIVIPAEIKRAAEREKEDAVRAENSRKAELMQAYKCFKVFACLKKIKGDEEMAFHANQGLWLFIFEFIAAFFFFVVPVIGLMIGIALGVLAIYLSAKGVASIKDNKRFEIPFISKIKLVK